MTERVHRLVRLDTHVERVLRPRVVEADGRLSSERFQSSETWMASFSR
jgi:hypothetical protein